MTTKPPTMTFSTKPAPPETLDGVAHDLIVGINVVARRYSAMMSEMASARKAPRITKNHPLVRAMAALNDARDDIQRALDATDGAQ